MAITTESFNADGTLKIFTVASTILSQSHCRVDFYYDNLDHEIVSSSWDVINNSIVFNNAPTVGYVVKITVSTDGEGLETAPSDVSDVAANIESVIAVGANIASVTAVATISSQIAALAADKATLDSLYADKATLDSLYADKATLDSLYSDKAKLDSLFTDKAKLDSLFADKAKLDSLYADKAALDNIALNIDAIITVNDNEGNIQEVLDNLPVINSVNEDALYVKEARELMNEPTGYDRYGNPEQLGKLELCVADPSDTTMFYIYGIDQDGNKINTQHTLKTAATWVDGTPIDVNISYQMSQSLVGTTPITWWVAGQKYERATIDVIELAPTSGVHFIYRDTIDNTLKQATEFSTDFFEEYAFTCVIYGNAGTGEKVVFADERHGIQMDGTTHKYLHMTQGTQYVSGFGLVGLTAGGTTYLQIDGGRYFDEDIDRTTPIQTTSPFWYIEGGTWRGVNDGTDLGYITGTNVNYNLNTNGTWSLTETANGKYTLVHFYATNDVEFPVVKLLGQREYANASDAKDGALSELKDLTLTGLPSPEFIPLFTIILTANGELTLTDNGGLYVDWRESDINSTQGSGDTLPSQVGNAGKFLSTNGSIPSWEEVPLPLTDTPVITIGASVNEGGTLEGSYASSTGSDTILNVVNGTITNHDEVAKTFTYNAYDITDDQDGSDTITAYSVKLGELQSASATADITVLYVPIVSDTAVTPDGNNFTTTNITYA